VPEALNDKNSDKQLMSWTAPMHNIIAAVCKLHYVIGIIKLALECSTR